MREVSNESFGIQQQQGNEGGKQWKKIPNLMFTHPLMICHDVDDVEEQQGIRTELEFVLEKQNEERKSLFPHNAFPHNIISMSI